MYQPIKRTNVRARLLSITDIIDFIDIETKEIPTYLYENLSVENTEEQPHAYWLSTVYPDSSTYSFDVDYGGIIYIGYVRGRSSIGVRPVIKVSKTV